jgi:hypothetical protein
LIAREEFLRFEGLTSIWASHDGFHEKMAGETPVSAVAQMVGFGPGRPKMLYLSMGN